MAVNVESARLIGVGSVSASPQWGTRAGSHRHHELIVITRGVLHATIGGTSCRGGAGDVLFYPAGVEHEEQSDPADPVETHFLALDLPNEPGVHLPRIHDVHGRLRTVASWLHLEWPRHAVGTGDLCSTLLRAFLLEWDALHLREEPPLVRKVRDHVRRNIAAEIDLQTLADVAGLSRYHFVRRYRSLAGRTPMEDLRAERVRHAHHLIATTNLPMKDVAARSGLCDEYHVGHLIRRYLNVTPGEIRSSRQ